MSTAYWRFKRGYRSDAIAIMRYLHRTPGSSLERIADHLWACVPPDSRREFDKHTAQELDRLQRYSVIEYVNGWHLSSATDPFARLLETTKDESELLDAFGDLAISYSRTVERRLATAMARFVADDDRSDDMRRITYVHFLNVVGIPVDHWPQNLMTLAVPADFDWSILNAFLPKNSRRKMA